MREYKFRVWDKEEKEMCFPNEDGLLWAVASNGQLLELGRFLSDCDYETMVYAPPSNPDRFIVEWYTGIDDTHSDKEIYDGDRVRVRRDDRDGLDEWQYYTVVYGIDYDYPAFDLDGYTGDVNGLQWYRIEGEIEIVGNIHEEGEE